MLREEFEDITSQYPCSMVYNLIEAEYRDMPEDVTKEEFCRRFMVNQDGIASRVQRTANKLWRDAMDGTQADAVRIKELEAKVAKQDLIIKGLQGWKAYCPDWLYGEIPYRGLVHGGGVILTDEEAKELVSRLIGFAPDKLTILHEAPKLERNTATEEVRVAGKTECPPRWINDWWNCVTFECRDVVYQMQDGKLFIMDQNLIAEEPCQD